ncbi:hypothetical protein DPMN_147517 [Dreissena polymorpha]|uniref:Uncharacterized protein n=1 Tax=Dreissena polymorpha TaxID=45954 RepID=A0A9D4F7W5_DREPO|nr:hypothetical protein DPMN_147517 [Dreissena polymorpha]
MPKDLEGEEVDQGAYQSLVKPLTKKGNLKLCENNRTISQQSHPAHHTHHTKVRPRNCWLDSELGGSQWNRSSTAELSLRKTCNNNASSSSTSSTIRKLSTCVWHDDL